MTRENHWPAKGSKLFISNAPDWQFNACLNWRTASPTSWHLYAKGYRRGASALLRQMLETAVYQDTLVYPIIFLYRQTVELQLKCIIKRGALLFDEAIDVTFDHEIDTLWAACRKLLDRMQDGTHGEEDASAIEAVQANIVEFADLDKQSFAFRYPETKKGLPSLLKGLSSRRDELQLVNLRHFGEVIEGVVNFLDAVDSELQVRVDAKTDAKREGNDGG